MQLSGIGPVEASILWTQLPIRITATITAIPPTNTKVTVSLPGTLAGPRESGRAFYLGLPARFDQLIERVRPVLDEVFRQWLGRPLRADVWQDVKLGGFGVEDPDVVPIRWDVGFETVGEKWLGITIPVVGEEPQKPTIDT